MRRTIFAVVALAALGFVIFELWEKPDPNLEIYVPELVATDSGGPDPILESSNVAELSDRILSLSRQWVGKPYASVFLINQRRANYASRLLELHIDEQMRAFALSEYIDSSVLLDSVAAREKMKTRGDRASLEEIVQKCRQHDVPAIRAKAAFADLSIPLHDYYLSNELVDLDEFLSRLDKCDKTVFEDRIACDLLCGKVFRLRELRRWDGVALPYCEALQEKLTESENPNVVGLAEMFRERVYFGHLDLSELVERLEQGDKEVLWLIQGLFRGLEAHPDCRLVFYQAALNVITISKRLEQKEDYESLMKRLAKITQKMGSEDKKSKVLGAIEELKARPWGLLEVKDETSDSPDPP